MNIRHFFILDKVRIVVIIAVIITPCLVEAIPFNGAEVSPELMGGTPLFFKLLVEEIHQFVEVPIVIMNSLFGCLKSHDQIFPCHNSAFFLIARSGEPVIGNNSKKSDTDTDKSEYNWCLYWIILLVILSIPFWPWFCKGGDCLGIFRAYP